MAGVATREFDVADHLNTPEEIAAYLDAVLEEGDDKLLLVALRTIVKSRGFAKVAQGAGVRRETLYQSFSEDGNPRLSTWHSVLGQLGLRLSVTPPSILFPPSDFRRAPVEVGLALLTKWLVASSFGSVVPELARTTSFVPYNVPFQE